MNYKENERKERSYLPGDKKCAIQIDTTLKN